jgi:O-antigen ligase
LKGVIVNLSINKKTQKLFFLFVILLLSNVSAFFRVIWLIPQVVMVQSILFLIASGIAMWILYTEKLLNEFFSNLKQNWFIFPFVVFAFVSIFWSIQPEISLFRWFIFLSSILIGGYIGHQYSLKETLEKLSLFGILLLLLSSLILIFFPDFGIMNYHIIQGAWTGLFWHKNHMGIIAALVNIIFLCNFVENLRQSKMRLFFGGILYMFSLFFLIKTDSVGAYLSSIFVHGVYFLLLIWLKIRNKLRARHYYLIVLIILIFTILLVTNLDALFGLFNRNTTLTGRIPMWNHLFGTYFVERPYFGYGFNAFWYLYPHRKAMQLAAGYPDPIVIADNGFIDILVSNGIVGFSMFIVFYFGMWFRSIRLAVKAQKTIHVFPVLIMVFSLVSNLSWSFLIENESFMMLIMIIMLFASTNLVLERQVNN